MKRIKKNISEMTYIQYAPLLYWAWLFTTISVLLWRDELPEWRCFFSFLSAFIRCVPLLFMRPAKMYAKRCCKMIKIPFYQLKSSKMCTHIGRKTNGQTHQCTRCIQREEFIQCWYFRDNSVSLIYSDRLSSVQVRSSYQWVNSV